MVDTLLEWLQDNLKKTGEVWSFLMTKPYDKFLSWTGGNEIIGVYLEPIKNLSWLSLIGISGLIVFIVIALIKWVVS